MRLAILPLSVACLATLFLPVANMAPLKVLSAPNLLRIGTTENIFVQCHGCKDVSIIVSNFPSKTTTLATTRVELNLQNNYQALGAIKISASGFRNDPKLKQYVWLEARFSDLTKLSKVVMVTFQSGYIFIQTDKPLYTPNSEVHYRVFALTPAMEPVNDKDPTDAIITVNIMTPDDVVIGSDPVQLKSGMYSNSFKLPEIVSPGVWKVIATFKNNMQHQYSSEFEVKEYVLPTFEVKITMNDKVFFYVDDKSLTINIQAMYLFGKEVDGSAYVVFGIFDENKRKRPFPESFQRVTLSKGKATATLKQEHMLQTHNKVGSSIYVSVSVLTTGSEIVKAEKHGIQIVESPYTINFKYTAKYFNPTRSFDVVVLVENPDGSPAPDVPIVVTPSDSETTTSKTGIAMVSVDPTANSLTLSITVRTNDIHIQPSRQTTRTMTANVYSSKTQSYLHIGVSTSEIKLEDDLRITFAVHGKPISNAVTYMIQSKGQLVQQGYKNIVGLTSVYLILRIEKEMLPSFRIIAYYEASEEVVSDSVWVDVTDTCMGSLEVKEVRNYPSFRPHQTFTYRITGDPGATVGLVAVDKGVYALNNKHHLTQKKVWDIVEKSDTGCTSGGGKDSMNVFHDAGLLFKSENTETDDREGLKCPVSQRRMRKSIILDVRTSLLSEYTEPLQRQCCLDGMMETPLSYSCERRKEYVLDGNDCADAFFKCCETLAKLQAESKTEALYLARSEEENVDFVDIGQISPRTKFPESWLWVQHPLPLCHDNTTNCKTTSLEKVYVLPDSITTWHVTGISLSPTLGLCIDDTLKMIVDKDFFIDLRLPYSAVRGEQLEIKAIIHNYRLDDLTVRVQLSENAEVCSSASNKGVYTQTVTVGRESTFSVIFVIIPMKDGEFPITVKASAENLQDGVQRMLKVVPMGIQEKSRIFKDLTPAYFKGKQMETMTNQIDLQYVVPNTPMSTEIYVTGVGVQSLVEKVIDGSYMTNLIRVPSGCGEQNMARMTLPITAVKYLDITNQWDKVGTSKRETALQHIKTGYQTQLVYRKPDGSFSMFPKDKSSSWLTSYTAKVFAMANTLIKIEESNICVAIKWVILNSQMPHGKFVASGEVNDKRIMGGMDGSDSDATLTAFSLISMQETERLCSHSVNSMPGSMTKAVSYLEGRLPSLTDSYAVAITSYALAVANKNKFKRDILFKFASSGLNHWPMANHLFTLEATAYALLALVKVKDFESASPIVKWLTSNRSPSGGYASTQSTTLVYQALAEYWMNAQEKYDANSMDIDIKIAGRTETNSFRVNRENAMETRSANTKNINQQVNVTAEGTGEATVSIVSLYYKRPSSINTLNNCERFDITVVLEPVTLAEGANVYLLKIEILYKNTDTDAGMTIVDISHLTGYMPDLEDLNRLSRGRDKTIQMYQIDKSLSEKGSLIIYLDKVSHRQRDEIAFKIKQTMSVGVLQPAVISIYEYDEQKPCVTFYHPSREKGQLLRLCQAENDEICKCAEEECSMQKKGKIQNSIRQDKACDAEAKIDYVYQVTMESYEDYKSTDIYKMRINKVIKEGPADMQPNNKLRQFIGYSHCREILNLKEGLSYLIMGTTKDILNTHNNEFEYVLGEKTWIEYWPTETECQTQKHGPTCEGMDELIYQFESKGCRE